MSEASSARTSRPNFSLAATTRSATTSYLGPGATIGVLGGGQLGRMLALAARRMGYRIIVLDPSSRCPTGQVADGVVVGALDDLDAARHLAAQVDVVTLDTEHVPADVLDEIAAIVPVRPAPAVLRVIQDRKLQKEFLDRLGIAQAKWTTVDSVEDVRSALNSFGNAGVIVKVRKAGYDGKGQVRVTSNDATVAERFAQLRGQPAVAEEVVPFVREVSVILARAVDGSTEVYPIADNEHRHHVLHMTTAPAKMAESQRQHAVAIATAIARALDHVGVIAVEMFELADGTLLVNEIAPRNHNSGHFTYGACATSQFEQHVRAVCGLRLGAATMLSGAIMVNLLGDLWRNGPPDWKPVLELPNARLHLYGKDAPAPGRKMGHVIVLDEDVTRAKLAADAMFARLAAG